jgi:1-deoxy-D-xylulose-5-phosphate reductoisomerase
MNAANEIAVAAFLRKRLNFLGIPRVIEQTMQHHHGGELTNVEQALHADLWGRRKAEELINGGVA